MDNIIRLSYIIYQRTITLSYEGILYNIVQDEPSNFNEMNRKIATADSRVIMRESPMLGTNSQGNRTTTAFRRVYIDIYNI